MVVIPWLVQLIITSDPIGLKQDPPDDIDLTIGLRYLVNLPCISMHIIHHNVSILLELVIPAM